jgi:hypothetical protein
MASMYVEIDLVDVDDDELIEELESRGYSVNETTNTDELLNKIYHLRRQNKSFETELDEYIMNTLGKVI